MTFYKLIRVLHRDLGYLFFGASIIYAISGIALNHLRDFNPSYDIDHYTINLDEPVDRDLIDPSWIESLLLELDLEDNEYKNHYYPNPNQLKVFLHHGALELNLDTGTGLLETIYKRPLLYQVNFLHYNPGNWWKWFSDIFCVAWIIISVTGLFIIKRGKNSVKRLGGLYTAIGIIIPLILLLFYL